VLSPPGIDRIILHDPADNNEFSADDIDFRCVREAGFFHFGYPTVMKRLYENNGAELVRLFSAAKAQGAVTSLDMSLPDPQSESGKVDWKTVLQKTLPHVDLFMPSIDEALYMLDRPEFERICAGGRPDFSRIRTLANRILDMGSRLALIKCGVHGLYVKTSAGMSGSFSAREIFQPSYRVERFVSALGSGDSAIAGFLSAMIRGFSLEDCARIASLSGALCCTAYDAVSAARPLERLLELTDSPLNHTELPASHLRYHDKERFFTS